MSYTKLSTMNNEEIQDREWKSTAKVKLYVVARRNSQANNRQKKKLSYQPTLKRAIAL